MPHPTSLGILLTISFLPLTACSSIPLTAKPNPNAQSQHVVNRINALIKLQKKHGHADAFCDLITKKLFSNQPKTRLECINFLASPTALTDSRAKTILHLLAHHDPTTSVRLAATKAIAARAIPAPYNLKPPVTNYITFTFYPDPNHVKSEMKQQYPNLKPSDLNPYLSTIFDNASHCRVGWITYTKKQIPILRKRIATALITKTSDPELGLFFDEQNNPPITAVISTLSTVRWKSIQPFESLLIQSGITRFARVAVDVHNPFQKITPRVHQTLPPGPPPAIRNPYVSNFVLDAPFHDEPYTLSDGTSEGRVHALRSLFSLLHNSGEHTFHISISPQTRWRHVVTLFNQLRHIDELHIVNTSPIPHNTNWFKSALAKTAKINARTKKQKDTHNEYRLKTYGLQPHQPTRIVYIVDFSGSQIQHFGHVVQQLKSHVRTLRNTPFQMILYRDDSKLLVPADISKMIIGTVEARQHTLNWLDDLPSPHGHANPIPAIEAAFRLKPNHIFILTDNILSSGRHEVDRAALLNRIAQLNKPNKKGFRIRISGIQFLNPDPLNTLQEITQRYGGTYRKLTKQDLSFNFN